MEVTVKSMAHNKLPLRSRPIMVSISSRFFSVVVSNTIITNELYAKYGAVADLTVDRLRTDFKKAKNYLEGDTSPIDYISIHDEEISFISATTDGSMPSAAAAVAAARLFIALNAPPMCTTTC